MKSKYLKMIKNLPQSNETDWSVYLLRCGDGTLYTGIAKDPLARFKKHQSGKGAAYTRTHLPIELIYQENALSRSAALIREAKIKKMPKAKKEFLVKSKKGND
ncbi:MAG: GIY-YIG nuclease family protein [Elusimicrobiota bacterium]